jgi:hypothetical protein
MAELDLTGLPGAELVAAGLHDLDAGRETIPALLVSIAARRLRRLELPVAEHVFFEPELRLYRALCREDAAGAYERYNGHLRRLVSFAHALEREQGQRMREQRAG